MATITDVARSAGVSVATVSRVLNGTGQVSDLLKRRVMKAVKDLDYQPNLIGRMLRCSKSRTILVVISILLRDMITGIRDAAAEAGYEIIMQYCPEMDADLSQFTMLHRGQADGAILVEVQVPKDVLASLSASYPIVQCGGANQLSSANTVSVNYEDIACQMTRHLLDLGCRRIATVGIVGRGGETAYFSRERLNGVHRALEEAGLEIDPALHFDGLFGYNTGLAAADYFLSLDKLPDAIFCFQDTMAFGLIQRLVQSGVRVPEDLAVAGFDNTDLAKVMTPALTSVDQPIYEIGQEAVRTWLMVEQDQGSKIGRHVQFDARLVLRDSTEKFRKLI